MSSPSEVTSVCPICGSSEVVHLCLAYMEAKAVQERNKTSTHGREKDQEGDNDKVASGQVFKEKTESPHELLSERRAEKKMNGAEESTEYPKFVVIYLGSSHLDRRFSPQTAMPWVMGEVRRSRDTFKEVQLQVCRSTLNAVAYEGLEQIETVFEHNLHTLSRFAKTHQDPRCFAYLRRNSLYSDFECHVFLAHEESVKSEAPLEDRKVVVIGICVEEHKAELLIDNDDIFTVPAELIMQAMPGETLDVEQLTSEGPLCLDITSRSSDVISFAVATCCSVE